MAETQLDELKMIVESQLHYPDPEKTKKTKLGSMETFASLLRQSQEDPETFWANAASELSWMKPWQKTMVGSLPDFKFFVGGMMNPAYNMLDRHIEHGNGNKLALVWEGENYETKFFTYGMLLNEVNKFANVLKGFGLKKGDRVAVFMPNLAETVIAVLACYRTGILFNTIFSGFAARSLKDRLINYEPQVLVTADAGLRRGAQVPLKAKIDEIVEEIESIKSIVVVNRAGTDIFMKPGRDFWWHELMSSVSNVCEPEPLEANEPGLVFYTSGTTGKPKGVVHSGVAFTVNNYVYTKYHMDHHHNDVLWVTADIGWLTMHIWGIVGAFVNGVTTIFYEGALDYPKPDRFYQIVDKYRVNKIFTAPTAIRMLMRYGEEQMKPYDVSTLDVISVVGEPFNPEAWHWAYEKLGKKKICVNNTWGQTETAGCPLAGAAWLTPMKPGSCGIQFLGAELDIVDEDGHPVPAGTPGNLIVKRPIPMMVRTLWREHDRYIREYFSQVKGAYFTYDEAVKDKDGHFWVTGRTDDVFNVAGHRLSTMELESAIIQCEGVAEAAVVGVPDEIKGLVPVAFVTLRKGYEPNTNMEDTIKDGIANNVGKIAVPRTIYFTEMMPKTPSGKIMRRLLKEILVHGDIKSDTTGLEDVKTVAYIKNLVANQK
ncbi:MAG: acetate--CoA ligase [Bacteroidetes bacterium]|nr:acetate--CoA ligase [Bacteroidota bacterium]MCL5738178.1 acetate--CoA ligase [Bacteroidota bacterium]